MTTWLRWPPPLAATSAPPPAAASSTPPGTAEAQQGEHQGAFLPCVTTVPAEVTRAVVAMISMAVAASSPAAMANIPARVPARPPCQPPSRAVLWVNKSTPQELPWWQQWPPGPFSISSAADVMAQWKGYGEDRSQGSSRSNRCLSLLWVTLMET